MRVYETGARIHGGLLDMGMATRRNFGGFGFMLCEPATRISLAKSRNIAINWRCKTDESTRDQVSSLVNKLASLFDRVFTIQINSTAPAHIGFGSKTALLLLIVNSVNEYFRLGLKPDKIIALTHRGGTSGVGVNGFFSGGLIVDLGHKSGSCSLLPSSAQRASMYPPMLGSIPVSTDWGVLTILPDSSQLSGKSEIQFFKNNTPVPRPEVLQSIALLYHGIIPSVIERDLDCLADSLWDFQHCGFKQKEILFHGDKVLDLMKNIRILFKSPVGMSSVGPLVYVIDFIDRLSDIKHWCISNNINVIGISKMKKVEHTNAG
jgi:beta-ribofuranosylaminobenzene 5'-phosphate synthase